MNRTANRDAYAAAAKDVSRYVENHLKKVLPEDTVKLKGAHFRAIGREAGYRYEEIQSNKREAYALLNQYATINLTNIASIRIQKELAKYKAALLKGYAFIMKTRQVITKEKVSYLIMTDSFANEPVMAKISLEQLLPHVSISVSKDKQFKLQIFKTDAIRADLAKQAGEAKSEAKQAYENIISYYKKFRTQGKVQGFQLERATRSAAKGTEQEYKPDTDAFYTGGDLRFAEGEVPEALNEGNENIEVKNLASNWGAQLASERGIETALITIQAICSKIQAKDIERALKEQIFESKNNIDLKLTRVIERSLETKVDTELKKVFSELGYSVLK